MTVPVERAEGGGPDSSCVAMNLRFALGAFPSAEHLHRRPSRKTHKAGPKRAGAWLLSKELYKERRVVLNGSPAC